MSENRTMIRFPGASGNLLAALGACTRKWSFRHG